MPKLIMCRRHFAICIRSCTIFIFMSALCLHLNVSAQSGKRRAPRARATPPPSKIETPVMPVPFRAGEQLAYRVLWSKYSVNAANLVFSVIEQRDFFGRAAWHFRVIAHTLDTVRLLYAVDD